MSEGSRIAAFTCALFAFSVLLGVMLTVADPAAGQQLLELFQDAIIGEVIDVSAPLLAATLFLNNLQACLVMFLGGASLGLVTVMVIVSNGVFIGSIIEVIRQEEGAFYIIAGLLPHGIFEIPAFLISGTLGFLLARALWREWHAEGDAAAEAVRSGRLFCSVVLPLVCLAAVTEAFITPAVIALVA